MVNAVARLEWHYTFNVLKKRRKNIVCECSLLKKSTCKDSQSKLRMQRNKSSVVDTGVILQGI